MPNNLQRFEDFTLDEGLSAATSDISTDNTLHKDSVNLSMGVYSGCGPRYGMSPVPNHNHFTNPTTSTDTSGITKGEASASSNLRSRRKVFGAYPIMISDFDAPKTKLKAYVWIGTYFNNPSASPAIVSDVLFMSIGTKKFTQTLGTTYYDYTDLTSVTTTYFKPQQGIDSGIYGGNQNSPDKFLVTTNRYASFMGRTKTITPTSGTDELSALTPINTSGEYPKYYASFAVASFPGSDRSAQYLLADVYSTQFGTETTTPNVAAPLSFTRYGNTKEMLLKNNKSDGQDYLIYHLARNTDASSLSLKTIYSYANTTLIYSPVHSQRLVNVNTNFPTGASITAGTDTLTGTPTTLYALLVSKTAVINSGFSMIASAPGKAIMGIIQDHVRPTDLGSSTSSKNDNFVQYVDPTDIRYVTSFVGTYAEDNIGKNTEFFVWPSYSTGVPLIKESASTNEHVTLGAANSGVLRKSSIYEIAYSIFDKSIGYETNVFTPVKLLTADDDFVSLSIFLNRTNQKTPTSYAGFPFSLVLGTISGGLIGGAAGKINWLQVRIYYRAFGTFEWIPAAIFDAAQLGYDATSKRFDICTGQVAALPGGQPGGFNDYSMLPKDQYTSTLFFQNRLFWMSDKQLIFSNISSPMQYPLRNATACQSGSFLGMIEHTYPGQSTQDSRLIVFSTDKIFVGKFKGSTYAIAQDVRVDENTSVSFNLDGSDFRLDAWTSITAFSSRSACVADGILYYWGPTGIRVDNGSEIPTKVSFDLEPDIFTWYDSTKTDEIFSVYNARTKEIIWFYRPNPQVYTSNTRALCYNTEKNAFTHFDFGEVIVDWAQGIDAVHSNLVNANNNGKRILCGVRDNTMITATQLANRVVYFDDIALAGDWQPGKATMCTGIVNTTGSVWRFYFDQQAPIPLGFSFPVTGQVTFFNTSAYMNLNSVGFDGIYTYTGLDSEGSGPFAGQRYVDIDFTGFTNVPVAFNALTPKNTQLYFPAYFKGISGFNFKYRNNYWAPAGFNAWFQWQYCHMSFKTQFIQGATPTVTAKYRSLVGTNTSDSTITLTDNSKGHCQVYNSIKAEKQNSHGQAISIELITGPDGIYCGNRWILQYLSFDVMAQDIGILKTFEG